MGKRVTSLLVAVLLLSGAAAASAQPAEGSLTGVWEGVLTGRQMATANGVMDERVRLVVKDDGTWTMTAASWQASGAITSRSQSFVLEGNFLSRNPGSPLGPAVYYLSQWRNNQVLGGNASARFNGLHITTGITLQKVQ